jgi:ArsR family transcriptional regulator
MSNQPTLLCGTDTESASGTRRRTGKDTCCERSFPVSRQVAESILSAELSFKALANEKRLKIGHALRDSERCACDLETVRTVPQSTVASHLQALRDARTVKTGNEGPWTYYRIADTASLQLLELAAALGGDR